MKKYYEGDAENIRKVIAEVQAGTDQTILNFMLDKHSVDMKILPNCYNLQDIWRKNLIVLDVEQQHWMEDKLYYLDAGWVYHFNAIPPNPKDRNQQYWIERTYEELYG